MSAYRPYPKYKPSGVEWLGDVPEHWKVAPFKWQIDRNDGGVWGDDPDGTNDTIVLRSTEQSVNGHWKMDDPAPRKLSKSEINSALLIEGDLLLTKSSGSSLHIGKTTLVTAEIEAMRCCYSNFMQRIRTAKSFTPELAWYVLNNDLARLQFDILSNSSTGLANLNGTMVGQIIVPVAPIPEQHQIASFLDRECGKLDALQAKQERLIELLKEKRQALISHAVTRGLNPTAKLKPSGIEWLGDVPEHWTTPQLKFLIVGIDQGKSPECEARTAEPDEWGVMKSGCVNWGIFREEEHKALPPHITPIPTTEIRKGDLLMSRASGSTDLIGSVAYVEKVRHRLLLSDKIFRLKVSKVCDPLFIWRMSCTIPVRRQIELSINGAEGLANNITKESIRSLFFTLPPLAEQRAIVAHLDEKCGKIDQLKAKAERGIELLKERRSALISAAVTGKIDVRET